MRDDAQRLADVVAAADAIAAHLQRGDLADGLVFDAVRVRLIEIGEAVKAIDPTVLAPDNAAASSNVAPRANALNPGNTIDIGNLGAPITTSNQRPVALTI